MSEDSKRRDSLPPELARLAAARLGAVQILYELSMHEARPMARAIKQYLEHLREGTAAEYDLPESAFDPDPLLLEDLVTGAWAEHETLDIYLNELLTNQTWSAERLSPVLRAIFRAALFEISMRPTTATPVVIAEYLHIANNFFDDRDVGFVNGVLDKAAKQARPPLSGPPPADE